MAHDIFNTLEKYLLYDIHKDMLEVFDDDVQGHISKNYIVKRVYEMLDNAEKIELITKDANSIYALYGVDYVRRRELWLESRGLCFRLIQQLNHISSIMVKGTNIQKYVSLVDDVYKLARKIKNIIISDDQKKKEHCREYLPKRD